MKVTYSLSVSIEEAPDLFAIADALTKASATLLIARLNSNEKEIRAQVEEPPKETV